MAECLMLQGDCGFFILEAARVYNYPKHHLEKRMGQIPLHRFAGAYSQLSPAHLYMTGVITGPELGKNPSDNGLGTFTSHCCISSHIPGPGGKDSLDLKLENAPCHFHSATRFLSLNSISIIPTL